MLLIPYNHRARIIITARVGLPLVYAHIVSTAIHVAQFVNLYAKVFIFLRDTFLESNSPAKEHSCFIRN
jgi:hypothetical protein